MTVAKGRKNGLYSGISEELSALMRTGWADTERHDLRLGEQAPYAARRRAALSARFPGERLVIPSGNLKVRSNDDSYPFRPYSGYVHMTGDQARDGALVLEPRADGGHDAYCYQLPRDSRDDDEFWTGATAELWMGRAPLPRRVGAACSACRAATSARRPPTWPPPPVHRPGSSVASTPSLEAAVTTDAERDAELEEALSDLRLVKDDLGDRRAPQGRGLHRARIHRCVGELSRAIASSERWIEGTFFRRARLEGNAVGYGSICAAGEHATIMHWTDNDGPVRPGDLLLLDAGVETHTLYTADVTRTLPISGTFTPLQRKIYDAVYEAQEAGMAAVKPGAAYRDFHEAAQRHLAAQAGRVGLHRGPRRPRVRTRSPAPLHHGGHRSHARAWTSTTARRPATRSTSTACWSRAWC